MNAASNTTAPGPTPTQYVALHRHDLDELRAIRAIYAGNVAADPRPAKALEWTALLAEFDAALQEAGIALNAGAA